MLTRQSGVISLLQTGTDYRADILQPGGTRDANDMLRTFLGREPNNAAFLRSLGLK